MVKRVTITRVAQEAGVSIKTVSNVINNTGSMRPETRAHVQQIIDQLGYRVNVSARAMKKGGTQLIGLAVSAFDQPFMPYLADSIVRAARLRGYGVIADTYQDRGGLEAIVDETKRLGADGWIFFATQPFVDQSLLRQPYPLVVIGDQHVHELVDSVTMPNTQAVREITGDLLDRGLRRIGLIGGVHEQDWSTSPTLQSTGQLRTLGFVQAFRERGLEPDWSLVVPTDWRQTGGRRACAQLLDAADSAGLAVPQAIIGLNDAMAIGALHELQFRRITVPETVQVIGFDNVPEAADVVPSLTSVDPRVADYAQQAVDLLIARIQGSRAPVQRVVMPARVVVRDSAPGLRSAQIG